MGVHQCVGQPIARLGAQLMLAALARRVRWDELAGDPVPKRVPTTKRVIRRRAA
jgi:cytochrome P450